jgi:hypothetical protein
MSEFRQIIDAEELEGKTIARVDFDEDRNDNSKTLIIFTDDSYVVLRQKIVYDYVSPIEIMMREPEIPYRIKHGIASPAEIASARQRAELEERQMQERIARQNRAEYERLKAIFESEANNHEKGQ